MKPIVEFLVNNHVKSTYDNCPYKIASSFDELAPNTIFKKYRLGYTHTDNDNDTDFFIGITNDDWDGEGASCRCKIVKTLSHNYVKLGTTIGGMKSDAEFVKPTPEEITVLLEADKYAKDNKLYDAEPWADEKIIGEIHNNVFTPYKK